MCTKTIYFILAVAEMWAMVLLFLFFTSKVMDIPRLIPTPE